MRGEAWGAWLWMVQAGHVVVELRWSHGVGPTVLMMSPTEEWTTPHPQPEPPLYRARMAAPAGWTWLAIVQSYDDQVDVQLTTHLPTEDTDPGR
jgi:hypothetical protein